MKLLNVLLLTFLLSNTLKSQVSPDVYWIHFSDKNNSEYDINTPEDFLSARAILRRSNQNIPVTVQDLPVNQTYINTISSVEGIWVLNKSKWFNGVTVFCEDSSLIENLLSNAFVDEVKREKVFNKLTEYKVRESISPQLGNRDVDTARYGPSYNQIAQHNGHVLHAEGFCGQGMQIAVFDAGFSRADTVNVLDSLFLNNQILGVWDFVQNDSVVYSGSKHGTYVLSILGGNMPDSLIGTAPKSDYWLLRTERANSEFPIEEFNWVTAAEFADSAGADIINSSLGYSTYDADSLSYSYEDMDGVTSYISRAADIAYSKGMLVVSSAGNTGNLGWHYITAPGDAIHAITVGAVDNEGEHASFSAYGPSYDGRVKPNVVARGEQTIINDFNQGGIKTGNGTSFSAPVMAGLVAVLWQTRPEATNEMVKEALEISAHLYQNPNDSLGYGIPNLVDAKVILQTVSIKEEINIELLNIYPNPAVDQCIIDLPSKTGTLSIFDLNGKLIMESYVNGQSYVFNTARLKMGMYIISYQTSTAHYFQKLIKQ